MARQSVGITHEEWLEALRYAKRESDEGVTVRELAEALDASVGTIQKQLFKLIRDGQWAYRGQRQITRIDRRPGHVPVYGPIEQKPKPRSSRKRRK